MPVLVGILAIVSAALYVLGSAVMQKGIIGLDEKRAVTKSNRNYVIALCLTPLFLLGIGIELAGFGLHSMALGLGSLAMISILQTSEIIFMLPASKWTAGTHLEKREYIGAAVVLLGLLGTIIFGRTTAGINDPGSQALFATTIICWIVTGLFVAVGLMVQTLKAAFLGIGAGILFGLVAAITKIVVDQLARDGLASVLEDWPLWAMIISGVAAAVLQVVAFGAGKLSASLSAIIVATPIATILISVTIFDEEFLLKHAVGWLLLFASYAFCVFGVVLLARSPAIAALHAEHETAPSS